jgi:energy-coupling factor transporter ATP-binding protein EcfA2
VATIAAEIVRWASGRPGWQQAALCDLAAGRDPGEDLEALVARIKAGKGGGEILTEEEIPVAGPASRRVELVSVDELRNVNALVAAGDLTFGKRGLTVVYGDNGSGKSGYARLIKSAVRSLHSESVHGDVFGSDPDGPQEARITYRSGGIDQPSSSWPDGLAEELGAVSFYDDACGEVYLTKESELGYRPSALTLLDGLITLCDRIATCLDVELAANAGRREVLPAPPEGSPAAGFLASLSAKTTSEQVDAACATGDGVDVALEALRGEEARLRATDPQKEKDRLLALAGSVRLLRARVDLLEGALDDEAVVAATGRRDALGAAREAARVASIASFEKEPLTGVGGEAWQRLWAAARRYSEEVAYPDHEFPVTALDAHCLLCQQPLGSEAGGRLGRFEAFVADDTARQVRDAEAALKGTVDSLAALATPPSRLHEDRSTLADRDEVLDSTLGTWFAAAEARRATLLAALAEEPGAELPALGASPAPQLADLAETLDAEAAAVDQEQFSSTLAGLVAGRLDIEGRKTLAAGRGRIEAEIDRLAERDKIKDAARQAETGTITRKSTQLVEEHVRAEADDRFARETDRLRLERIHLKRAGGHKGRVRHRPALLGSTVERPVSEVLSEGEKTALGLAGYFTEAYFDAGLSALVLDDPVSSLDHIRRGAVAERLTEFAAERQVIVFTHDLEFVVALSAAAGPKGVPFTERSVRRRGDRTPGVSVDSHPWKAKDVNRRLEELTRLLAEIKRERTDWDADRYEEECAAWAGKLSETWERILHLDIAQTIYDPATSQVQPRMLRVIARVTEDDNREFQESYARISEWAQRHDKSPSRNYVAPEPEALAAELEVIRSFSKRIKGYQRQ